MHDTALTHPDPPIRSAILDHHGNPLPYMELDPEPEDALEGWCWEWRVSFSFPPGYGPLSEVPHDPPQRLA